MTLPEFLESSDAIESQMRAEIDRCVAEGNLAEAELRRAEAENRFESLTNELTSHEFENLMLYASIHVAVGIVPPLEAMKALYLIHKEKGPLTWKAVTKEVKERKAMIAAEKADKGKPMPTVPMSPQKTAWKAREREILRESWIRSGGDPTVFETGNLYMGLPRRKTSGLENLIEPTDQRIHKQSKATAVHLLILLARHLPGGKWFVPLSTSRKSNAKCRWAEAWDFVEVKMGKIPDSIRHCFPDRSDFTSYAPKSGIKPYRAKPRTNHVDCPNEKNWETFRLQLFTAEWLTDSELRLVTPESGPRSGGDLGG